MALIAVEAVPVGSKPPATNDSMRTSIDGRFDFGASASLLTRASPMHFSGAFKRGSAIMLKLFKPVEPSSILAEELSPYFIRSTVAPSVRSRVLVSGSTSASVARCGC